MSAALSRRIARVAGRQEELHYDLATELAAAEHEAVLRPFGPMPVPELPQGLGFPLFLWKMHRQVR